VSSTLVVILIVVAVLLVAALVAGVVLARRRRIDLTETKPAVEEKKPGGYQAGGGISLAPGGEVQVEVKVEEPAP
jgi:fused signal recognition particle receptor